MVNATIAKSAADERVNVNDEVITDANVAAVLRRVVGVVNPVLDVLATADPLGLKERTRDDDEPDGVVDRALDALAWVLDTAEVPGTEAWDRMDLDQRTRWWVRRIGAANTVFVAFPGMFGVLAKRLPMQDLLGFANQAIVLVAVARERGVVDRHTQIRLLAAVLCGRTVPVAGSAPEPPAAPEPDRWTPFALARTLWRTAKMLAAIDSELERRPHPTTVYRYLGYLPAVGAVAGYIGELGALHRAADEGIAWLAGQSAGTSSDIRV